MTDARQAPTELAIVEARDPEPLGPRPRPGRQLDLARRHSQRSSHEADHAGIGLAIARWPGRPHRQDAILKRADTIGGRARHDADSKVRHRAADHNLTMTRRITPSNSIATNGDQSSPPLAGRTRRIGARIGSVS